MKVAIALKSDHLKLVPSWSRLVMGKLAKFIHVRNILKKTKVQRINSTFS